MTSTPTPASASASPPAAPFDTVARDYDSIWTDGYVGGLQRGQVWRELLPAFRAGDRVLELGCGTGMDAARLAAAGVRVHATDASVEMLRAAAARIEREKLSDHVTFERCAVEQLSNLHMAGPFDGAFSDFGVLNCVRDLRAPAGELARLIRPGGKLVLCIMGRFCLWETAWYLLHAKPGKAFRRLRAGAGGIGASLGQGARIRVYYPSMAGLLGIFGNDFDLLSFRSVGIFVPPSYLEAWAVSWRMTFDRMSLLDRSLGKWPVLRASGDHRLVTLVRRT